MMTQNEKRFWALLGGEKPEIEGLAEKQEERAIVRRAALVQGPALVAAECEKCLAHFCIAADDLAERAARKSRIKCRGCL
jgi:hypothetical protein